LFPLIKNLFSQHKNKAHRAHVIELWIQYTTQGFKQA
jgi:hypothetical protein